jgi:hypothetical protein
MTENHKAIWKRMAWEFAPPLVVAALWVVLTTLTGFDKQSSWATAVRDFSVGFFMCSWFWNQYNRVEHQTTTRQAGETLKVEVGLVKQTLNSIEEKVVALAKQPAPAQSPEYMEVTDLVRTANNHVDVISAQVNASIGEFTLNAQGTVANS